MCCPTPLYVDYNGSEDPGAMQWNSSGKNVRVLTGAKAMRGVAKFLCMRTWENFNLVLEKEEKRKINQKGGRTKREAYAIGERWVVHGWNGLWKNLTDEMNKRDFRTRMFENQFLVVWSSSTHRLLFSVKFLLFDIVFLFKITLKWEKGTGCMGYAPACVNVTAEIKE